MHITNDTDSPWYNAKVYEYEDAEVAVVRAASGSPVRYYAEIYRFGRYVASYGSNVPFAWMMAFIAFMHKCPKQEMGFRCKHRAGECGADNAQIGH